MICGGRPLPPVAILSICCPYLLVGRCRCEHCAFRSTLHWQQGINAMRRSKISTNCQNWQSPPTSQSNNRLVPAWGPNTRLERKPVGPKAYSPKQDTTIIFKMCWMTSGGNAGKLAPPEGTGSAAPQQSLTPKGAQCRLCHIEVHTSNSARSRIWINQTKLGACRCEWLPKKNSMANGCQPNLNATPPPTPLSIGFSLWRDCRV